MSNESNSIEASFTDYIVTDQDKNMVSSIFDASNGTKNLT